MSSKAIREYIIRYDLDADKVIETDAVEVPIASRTPASTEEWADWANTMISEYNLPRGSDSPLDILFYYLCAQVNGELGPDVDLRVQKLMDDHPEYELFMLWQEVGGGGSG